MDKHFVHVPTNQWCAERQSEEVEEICQMNIKIVRKGETDMEMVTGIKIIRGGRDRFPDSDDQGSFENTSS